MNRSLMFLVLGILGCIEKLSSQNLRFENINTEHGLSESAITCLFQDRYGFIWIGTQEGLNQFDGQVMRVFKSDNSDTNSLSSNFIRAIEEDGDGNLWIGTYGGGLNHYDRAAEKFTVYKNSVSDPQSLPSNVVSAIKYDSAGYLWVGTYKGLARMDMSTKKFKYFQHQNNNSSSISNSIILSLYKDRDGTLWVGTNSGLNKYNEITDSFVSFLDGLKIRTLREDDFKNLWIGTSNGLIMLDRKTNQEILYKKTSNNENSLVSDNIACILYHKNNLWIGTLDGLNKFDLNKKNFLKYKNESQNIYSIADDDISAMLIDKTGNLWVGTRFEGISKLVYRMQYVDVYGTHIFTDDKLGHVVQSIFEDSYGDLWIGTTNGLGNLTSDGKLRSYVRDIRSKKSPSKNSITTICESQQGQIWIATENGGEINIYDRKLDQFFVYKEILANTQDMQKDYLGALWMGTNSGLYKIDSGKITIYTQDETDAKSLSNNVVIKIFEDRDKRLWIGTVKGLNLFDRETEKFTSFYHDVRDSTSLSDNIIRSMADDGINLWIATAKGLDKFDRVSRKFTRMNKNDGVPQDRINLVFTTDDVIWLSTVRGIYKFDKKTQRFKIFYTNNSSEIYPVKVLKNGKIAFGGTKEFYIFHPDSIKENLNIPSVVITSFKKFNREFKLPISITMTDEIGMSYDDYVFSFEYAALDYTQPKSNQYAYMLEGFDSDWNYVGNKRDVTYTNIDPGKYIFRIKASNNDGIWNEEGKSITINILPPFWKTWWFTCLWVLSAGTLFYLIISFRYRHVLALERLRSAIAADLHDNIGADLTDIAILSEIIIQKSPPESLGEMIKIRRKCESAIESMKDIVWLVNPVHDHLSDVIIRLRDYYQELLSGSNILFKTQVSEDIENLRLPLDHRQHIYLILKEGISNAVKYSGCNEIVLETNVVTKRNYRILLKDNGKGFDREKIILGNGLNNMQKRAGMIGGDLRIQSEIGNGSIVELCAKVP